MDPSSWSLKDWVEFIDGPAIFAVLLVLNMRGLLLWKGQVDQLVLRITTAADKLDAVRCEQIEEERQDKNSWKGFCDTLKITLEEMKRRMAQ